MKRTHLRTSLLTLALALTGRNTLAAVHDPVLHVDPRYDSCFFDLHPELTRSEFQEFAGELGAILRPRQMSDATTLGRGRFELGVQFSHTPIDDSKGAWNNTMSHPTKDHHLGDAIEFPRLVARVGVSDRADLGFSGGADFESNYGFAAVDVKIALMKQGPGRPVSIALRPSLSSLIGPDEVWVGNAGLDLSVSRTFGAWSPYVGGISNAARGVERSKDVDLEDVVETGSVVYGGVAFRHRKLSLAIEAEHGKLTSYSFQVSGRF